MANAKLFTTVLAVPTFFFVISPYLNFDTASAVLFLAFLIFLIIKHRKKLDFQSMLKIGKIPIVYAVLWRTKFGISFMESFASKRKELVKLFGYCSIGLGFFGMIFISLQIAYLLFRLFISPKEASQGVSLVLPLTHIPGLGYLSFWHFLIALFITILVHEFAHGIVAKAHNIHIKSSGLGVFSPILPILPLAFVEPDEKQLQKSPDIVQYSIYAAGPIVNVILSILVMLVMVWAITPVENAITHPIGFSFTGVMKDFPADEAGLLPGTVIKKANGIEILDYGSFSKEVGVLKPGGIVTLEAEDSKVYMLTAKESVENPGTGYIGITGIQNERRINDGFELIDSPFFWLKGLLRWLLIINFAVGLINLLPMIITDGGRMLKVALEKLIGKGRKADSAWAFVGLVFLFTIILALAMNYGFKILSVIGN